MKILNLSAALSAAIISFLPGFQSSVKAEETDYLCFMTTHSGQVVDLSESLCGASKSLNKDSANSDQAFIQDYEKKLSEYPDVRDNLLLDNQQSPESNIRRAKDVCNALRSGLSMDDIQEKQDEENIEKSSVVNAEIIDSLATKYYCPEFSNR